MNHLGDTNKMVSDTPRTDEAYFKNSATMYDLAGEMKQIERELNVANEKIEVLLIADCERLRIEEELNAANNKIASSGWRRLLTHTEKHTRQTAMSPRTTALRQVQRLAIYGRTILRVPVVGQS